ncbi:HD domain-containing protein [Pyrofollis japonicus]|nr:HD domain-containing protein [Pyrofollis japonicus]
MFEDICIRYSWCKKIVAYVLMMQGMDESHGLPHTIRVLCNSLYLVKRLQDVNMDEEVVILASLLHDIGRGFEDYLNLHHAEISAILAKPILEEVGISRDKQKHVIDAILEHSFSIGGKPSSMESCIVSDADKLDALGAIGVYRLIETSAMRSRVVADTLAHVWEKLVKLPDLMCLDVSRQEAHRRLKVLKEFIDMLRSEILPYEDAIAKSFTIAFDFLEKERKRLTHS